MLLSCFLSPAVPKHLLCTLNCCRFEKHFSSDPSMTLNPRYSCQEILHRFKWEETLYRDDGQWALRVCTKHTLLLLDRLLCVFEGVGCTTRAVGLRYKRQFCLRSSSSQASLHFSFPTHKPLEVSVLRHETADHVAHGCYFITEDRYGRPFVDLCISVYHFYNRVR